MELVRRSGIARWIRPAPALAPAFLACAALAASDEQHREHEAHEHGHGTLDIVLEGEELLIELRIPAVNVVGFEHAPRDEAEREAVRKALVPFGDAESVLVMPAEAECESEEAVAEIWSMAGEDDHEGDGHGDGEGHEHEHEDDGHEDDAHKADEHGKDEHDADSGAEEHSELHATYRFHCHEPGKLDRIDVRVFEHLHGAEEIDVRIVTPTAQLATEVHPGETVVELAP
jgi:hypothetical protein